MVTPHIKLQTFIKYFITVSGELKAGVFFIGDNSIPNFKIFIIKEEGPSLIWKTLLKASKLFCPNVSMFKSISKDGVIRKFLDIFADEIDTIKSHPFPLQLNWEIM